MTVAKDNALYLRDWAADIRKHSDKSVDADRLDAIAEEIDRLRALTAVTDDKVDRAVKALGEVYMQAPAEPRSNEEAAYWRKKAMRAALEAALSGKEE